MPGFFESLGNFFTGTPEKRERVSTLTPSQMKFQQQLENAAMGRGAQGAFGTAADYYRDLLSNENPDLEAFTAPELRQFREQIIPGLAEQFAGMGSGGLNSSGFRNAAVGAGTDLAERLGAIRARLRESGAQGLMGIGNRALTPYTDWQTTQPGTEGFLSSLAPAVGTAAGAFLGGPLGGAFGGMAGNWLSNAFGGNKVGKNTSPYGNLNNMAGSVNAASFNPLSRG